MLTCFTSYVPLLVKIFICNFTTAVIVMTILIIIVMNVIIIITVVIAIIISSNIIITIIFTRSINDLLATKHSLHERMFYSCHVKFITYKSFYARV